MSLEHDFLDLVPQPSLQKLTAVLNKQLNPLLPELTPENSQLLLTSRQEQLVATHRLELSTRPLEKLTEQLSFSPHVTKDNFLELIIDCQESFYWVRNEASKKISDDDLIDLILDVFNNQTEGSLEATRNYLESWVRSVEEPLTLRKENDRDED